MYKLMYGDYDYMGSEELANIFRIAQTDVKLKRDNIDNEYTANSVHFEVGREIKNSIEIFGCIFTNTKEEFKRIRKR